MKQWLFMAVAFSVILLPRVASSSEPGSSSKKGFDLEARKQQQPWLWIAPSRQVIPQVKDSSWPLSPIDNFILQKLETAGLKPAPAADDRTWLRRVYFAVIGLPPTREQTAAFLADKRPGARERVVDELLASPHFGERWARHWMDLMRYAESRGHEGDYLIANAWHYRDYLIRAFNENVPYDQFLLEHLAGDLLAMPRLRPGTEITESVLGTGWAFLGEENHSPVDIRQDECERIDNKVDVFSKTFLGLTVSCARCHDHKFDPIRAQDYYALSGFMLGSSYRQVRFEAMENNRKMARELSALRQQYVPVIAALVASSREKGANEISSYLLRACQTIANGGTNALPAGTLASERPLQPARLQRWVDQLNQALTNSSNPLHAFANFALGPNSSPSELMAAKPTLKTEFPRDATVIADYTTVEKQPWKTDGQAFGARPAAVGDFILGNDPSNPIAEIMTYGAARRDLFWKRIKAAPGNENDSGTLAATSRSGQTLSTPTVTLGVGKLHYLIRGKTRVYAGVDSHLMVEGPLHGRFVQVFDSGAKSEPRWVTHDLTAYSGHRVHVEFGPEGDGDLQVLMVVEAADVPRWLPNVNPSFAPGEARSVPEFAKEIQNAAVNACQLLARGTFTNSRENATQAAVANWLVQHPELFCDAPDPALVEMGNRYVSALSNIASRVRWESHTAVAWFDGTGVDENILLRGKPTKIGTLAPRSLPVAFSSAKPITTRTSSGRYELARQLVDPENPLVARTIANRIWHHLFGRGIVASVDNFGSLGDRPTHPELLDHLAWQLVHEDNWSLKRLIKRLVLTQTFAMSSRAMDARAEELDASNLLLHRMPVRRLEGEAIRDALLAVSGRLNPVVGGPPVTIYLTEFLVGRGRPAQSGPLDGDGRRSIYTALHRNFLPTLMQTFDTPTPFSTVGKRNVTNVPAQSLALMNDPLFHQQAGVWAKRLLREMGHARDDARVSWLFESAYMRPANVSETKACLESLAEFRQLHDPSATQELECWTDLCHALLNANEFIYLN